MIRFACPGCSATYTASDEKAGKLSTCPKCKMEFEIPAASDVPPPITLTPVSAPKTGEPIEIAPCPKCGTKLTVEPRDLGVDVECPSCQKVFTARKPGGEPPRSNDDGRPRRRHRDDDEFDDRPSRHRRDEEDDDDRPRRRRRHYAPHRGVMILVFGILSFVVCVIFGIAAIIMANSDLREMDSGRMDPEGRQMTTIGRILGIISLVLTAIVVLFYCVIVVAAVGAGAGGR